MPVDRAFFHQADFYPRSPCGERRAGKDPQDLIAKISIHALLAESDVIAHFDDDIVTPYFYPRSPCGERPRTCKCLKLYRKFLSTLSLRRATRQGCEQSCGTGISIHALLAESDPGWQAPPRPQKDFYPRSPCGERRVACCVCMVARLFLSTLSLRRATGAAFGGIA